MFLNRLTLIGMNVERAKLIAVKTGRGGHLAVTRMWLPQDLFDRRNPDLHKDKKKRGYGLQLVLRMFDETALTWVEQVRIRDIVLVDGHLCSYRKMDLETGKPIKHSDYYMRVNAWKGLWANPKKALEARGKVVLERDEFDRLQSFARGTSEWDVPGETLKDLGIRGDP